MATVKRPCDVCGVKYAPQRSSSKYCGPTCRKRAQRIAAAPAPVEEVRRPTVAEVFGADLRRRPAPAPAPAAAPAQLRAVVEAPAAPVSSGRGGRLTSATEARLAGAGLAGSWQAEAALDITRAIDAGAKGTALAALHRELRAAMTEAMRGVDAPDSAVRRHRDQVAAARERRRARSG